MSVRSLTPTSQEASIQTILALYDDFENARKNYLEEALKGHVASRRILNMQELPTDREEVENSRALKDLYYVQGANFSTELIDKLKNYVLQGGNKIALASVRCPGDDDAQQAFITKLDALVENNSSGEQRGIKLVRVANIRKYLDK